MDFSLSAEQQAIRDAVERICARFGDDYWLAKDREGGFPDDFHRAFADDGWLGICIPQEYGGAGLGVTEAAHPDAGHRGIRRRHVGRLRAAHEHLRAQPGGGVRQRRAEAAHAAAADRRQGQGVLRGDRAERRARHAQAQDQGGARGHDRYLLSGQKIWISTAQVATKMLILARTTPLEQVKRRTEGLSLFYTDLDRSYVDVREIPKMGRSAVDSNELFIDNLPVPVGRPHRRGGQGLRIHPARHESGAHPDRRRGGRARPRRAAQGGQLREGAHRVRPADRAEPGDPASARANAGWSWRRPT